MILYYGSNVEVNEIDLNSSEVGKDFGVGFILANRANGTRAQIHDFDIVHGPIANDDVGFQIRRLLAGIITIDASCVYSILQRELKEGKIVAG